MTTEIEPTTGVEIPTQPSAADRDRASLRDRLSRDNATAKRLIEALRQRESTE